jgi:hypothetical protein
VIGEPSWKRARSSISNATQARSFGVSIEFATSG